MPLSQAEREIDPHGFLRHPEVRPALLGLKRCLPHREGQSQIPARRQIRLGEEPFPFKVPPLDLLQIDQERNLLAVLPPCGYPFDGEEESIRLPGERLEIHEGRASSGSLGRAHRRDLSGGAAGKNGKKKNKTENPSNMHPAADS